MNWSTIAMTRLDELTAIRSSGRPVNTHVVPSRTPPAPDFERMKTLVHNTEQTPLPPAEPNNSEF